MESEGGQCGLNSDSTVIQTLKRRIMQDADQCTTVISIFGCILINSIIHGQCKTLKPGRTTSVISIVNSITIPPDDGHLNT